MHASGHLLVGLHLRISCYKVTLLYFANSESNGIDAHMHFYMYMRYMTVTDKSIFMRTISIQGDQYDLYSMMT